MNDKDWQPSALCSTSAKTKDLQFIFQQANSRLKEVSDEGDMLYNKSLTFISIGVTLIIAAGGFIFSQKEITPLLFSSGSVLISFWILVSVLKPNIKPADYHVPGSDPSMLFIDTFFTPFEGYEKKSAEWRLLFNEILECESRISHNRKVNAFRKKNLNSAYDLIYKAPAIFVLVHIIASAIFLLVAYQF